MATTAPIKDASDVVRAIAYIEEHYDPIYSLLWRLISTTGLRVSDAITLKWDFIEWQYSTVKVIESKGTKSAVSRAIRKEKQAIKNELIAINETDHKLISCDAGDVLDFVNKKALDVYQARIDKAADQAPKKTRIVDIEENLLADLREWHRANHKHDDGFIFSKNSMQSHQAKRGTGQHITRQAVWRVFRDVGYYLTRTGTTPVKGSCHGLRKTYALHMANETGNLSLVIKTMNWASVQVASRYLGHDEAERKDAADKVFKKLAKKPKKARAKK